MYMQDVLCSVTERTLQLKCWFRGLDKGTCYAMHT